jgi:apolipoprotein N-acyltransferase
VPKYWAVVQGRSRQPPNNLSWWSCFHHLSAFLSMSKGVLGWKTNSAAASAFGWWVGWEGGNQKKCRILMK